MLYGKSHNVIPLLEPIYSEAVKALAVAVTNCQNPTVLNAVELRVSIENILYKIDKLAFQDAKGYTNDKSDD